MREPAIVVGVRPSAKRNAVLLGGLRRVRVHEVITPRNRLQKTSVVS